MVKLHNITLASAISILSLSIVKVSHSDASTFRTLSAQNQANIIELAQKPATSKDKSSPEDEMIDALQKRQEKLENLEVLKNLDKNKRILEGLQEKQLNIQSVEELQAVKKIVNDSSLDSNEILDRLQEKQLNIQSIEELQELKTIVNGQDSNQDESFRLSQPLAFKMLTVGLPASLLVILICTPILKGIGGVFKSNVEEKLGKPKVPAWQTKSS